MQQMHFLRSLRVALVALTLIGLLAACGGRDAIRNGATTVANMPNQFDMTVPQPKTDNSIWRARP